MQNNGVEPTTLSEMGEKPDGGASSPRLSLDLVIIDDIILNYSEWWVKVGGKQSPLSAWVLRNCGKKFQGDGSGAQTYRHCG